MPSAQEQLLPRVVPIVFVGGHETTSQYVACFYFYLMLGLREAGAREHVILSVIKVHNSNSNRVPASQSRPTSQIKLRAASSSYLSRCPALHLRCVPWSQPRIALQTRIPLSIPVIRRQGSYRRWRTHLQAFRRLPVLALHRRPVPVCWLRHVLGTLFCGVVNSIDNDFNGLN